MSIRRNQIAYRCPDCGVATVGFLGGLSSVSDMLRLKCECGGSSLDVKRGTDKKLHLSVPCVYCKDEHGYNISAEILTRDDTLRLSCPFSGMDIFFSTDASQMGAELDKSADELSRVMQSMEAEELRDIQPQDVAEDSCPPDPAIYDTLNFVVRDLEAEGAIKCPCGKGGYGLRFCDEGMQVYCESCGASYIFHARSVSLAEEYLSADKLELR